MIGIKRGKDMLILFGLSLIINAAFLVEHYDFSFLIGSLGNSAPTHKEIAYNVYRHTSVKINPARLEALTQYQFDEQRNVNISEIEPERFGPPTEYRSLFDTVGYGLVLGLIWKVTRSLRALDIQFLQYLLFSFLTLLIFSIALFLFDDRRVARVATGVHLFFFPLALVNSFFCRDVWAFYALVIFLFGALGYVRGRIRLWHLVVCGSLVGMTQFVRPIGFPSFVAMNSILLLSSVVLRGQARRLLTIVATMVATNVLFFWVPFMVHNKMAYDRYVVVPSGIGLLQGLGEFDNPWGIVRSDVWYRDYMWREHGLKAGTQECENKAQELYRAYIAERPLLYVRNILYRVPKVIFPYFLAIPRFYDTYISYSSWQRLGKRLTSVAGLIDLFVHYIYTYLFLVLAYAGIMLAWWRKRYFAVLLVIVGGVLPAFQCVLTVVENRFIVSFIALYSLFVGFLLVALYDALSARLLVRSS